MDIFNTSINSIYGNTLRVRVCGLLFHDSKILLVKHRGLGTEGMLWVPPGGGVNFGESLSVGLRREIQEETNLKVTSEDFLFIHEFIKEPLHAIEFFFKVEASNFEISIGSDPEHDQQIIEDVKYFSEKEIYQSNLKLFHQIFMISRSFNELRSLKGLLKI